MKYTLGIDQSFTSTGYVILDEQGTLVAFDTICSTKGLTSFERAKEISDALMSVYDKWTPTIVAIEGLGFGGVGNATRDLAGLQHVIMVALLARGFKLAQAKILSPKTVKMKASGKGNATKIQMFEALPETISKTFQEAGFKKTKGLYDLTDAYFIGMIGGDLLPK